MAPLAVPAVFRPVAGVLGDDSHSLAQTQRLDAARVIFEGSILRPLIDACKLNLQQDVAPGPLPRRRPPAQSSSLRCWSKSAPGSWARGGPAHQLLNLEPLMRLRAPRQHGFRRQGRAERPPDPVRGVPRSLSRRRLAPRHDQDALRPSHPRRRAAPDAGSRRRAADPPSATRDARPRAESARRTDAFNRTGSHHSRRRQRPQVPTRPIHNRRRRAHARGLRCRSRRDPEAARRPARQPERIGPAHRCAAQGPSHRRPSDPVLHDLRAPQGAAEFGQGRSDRRRALRVDRRRGG